MPELNAELNAELNTELNAVARPLRDVLWVVGTFLLLGLLAGVVWWWLADPPSFVRTEDNAVMEQAQLGRQVAVDGRFVVCGLVAGLVGGFALMARRRADPVVTVVVGAIAAVGAGFLALGLGETLGHQDVQAALRATAVGERFPDTLRVISHWVVAVWPFGFLVAALSTLLGSSKDERSRVRVDAPV